LCAVTIAYSFQRGKEPEEKSTVKFSSQQKNDSASSLILFAMNNVPVGKEWDVYLMTAPGLFNPNPGMKKLEDFCLYLFISENSLYLHLPDGTKKTITSQEIPLLDQLMPPRNHFYQPLENPKKCQDHKKFCQAVLAYTTAQGWTSQRELSGIYQGRLGQITARYTAYLNPNPGVAIRAISAITDMFNPAKYLPYKASTPAGTTPAITHKPG
jgi:hypothetical protein